MLFPLQMKGSGFLSVFDTAGNLFVAYHFLGPSAFNLLSVAGVPLWRDTVQTELLVKVILCLVPSILVGGLAYWFYVQPSLSLQASRKAVIDRALSFMNEFLWNASIGSYRECPVFSKAPCAMNYWKEDNYLAYVFNTE